MKYENINRATKLCKDYDECIVMLNDLSEPNMRVIIGTDRQTHLVIEIENNKSETLKELAKKFVEETIFFYRGRAKYLLEELEKL